MKVIDYEKLDKMISALNDSRIVYESDSAEGTIELINSLLFLCEKEIKNEDSSKSRQE